MVTKNDDTAAELLIREVDEELRQEQFTELWKKYGSLFIGAGVLVVVAVAAWQGWNSWQNKQRQMYGTAFSQASDLLQQGKRDEAVAAFTKLATEGTAGYKVLSELKLADLKLGAGDRDGAIALYDKVASSSADAPYRDIATLKSAYLKVDTADAASLQKVVEPLSAESSAWRHSAREILALLALKQGDAGKAGEWLRKVADDPAAPQGVRARATELLSATAVKVKN